MIFEKEEFDNLTGAQIAQKAQVIKQRFDQKRNYFHQMRNQISVAEHWDELNKNILEFDAKFNPWNKQWANIARSNKIEQIIQFFEQGDEFYAPLSSYLISIIPNSDDEKLVAFKEEILTQIQNDILSLTSSVNSKIEQGIDDVLGLKSELGLEQNFGENIDTELTSSNTSKNNYRNLFLGSLGLIPGFLLASVYFDIFKSLSAPELYTLRAGVSLSLFFMSYFFFSQYKLYQMMSLRYSHLSGFLGGGATFLGRLVGTENDEVKKEINKKMAELFMQLDDISGLVKKSSHPSEISMDKLGKLFEQMGKVVNK